MRHRTLKRARRDREAKRWRERQCELVGRCEVCLKPRMPYMLCVHEVANGNGLRVKAQDKAYATLVVCREPWPQDCHGIVGNEPEAKQLARLYLARQSEYDLAAYNYLVRPSAPNRIEQHEVDRYVRELLAQGRTM